MESNNTASNSDLLVKLTRLEDQVSTLSLQLESNTVLIGQLKQTLSDRDLQISELEARLSTAQISLQKTAIDKINLCRAEIKKGLDAKLVNPVLTQIRQCIAVIEGLVAETGAFIRSCKAQLQGNISATSDFIHQGPGYALVCFEKKVVAPANLLIKKTRQAADDNYKVGRVWFEQELQKPGKVIFNRIVFVARELPLDARLVLQTRVLDPALMYIDKVPGYINAAGVRIAVTYKQLTKLLVDFIQQCLDFIEEQVKKSQFWDGKHRTQAA
jgi:hypothetical protein